LLAAARPSRPIEHHCARFNYKSLIYVRPAEPKVVVSLYRKHYCLKDVNSGGFYLSRQEALT